MKENDAMEDTVRAALRDIGVDDTELTPDSELVSTGLLDSPDLVRLATELERACDLSIPDGDIQPELFDSIRRIAAYLQSRRGGS